MHAGAAGRVTQLCRGWVGEGVQRIGQRGRQGTEAQVTRIPTVRPAPSFPHPPQTATPPPPSPRDAQEGKGPQRRPPRRLGRRLKEVAKAVGGGYCRLQIPLKRALGVRETVAGHRLGALEAGGGVPPPPFLCTYA